MPIAKRPGSCDLKNFCCSLSSPLLMTLVLRPGFFLPFSPDWRHAHFMALVPYVACPLALSARSSVWPSGMVADMIFWTWVSGFLRGFFGLLQFLGAKLLALTFWGRTHDQVPLPIPRSSVPCGGLVARSKVV
jgi:hypothetical protein